MIYQVPFIFYLKSKRRATSNSVLQNRSCRVKRVRPQIHGPLQRPLLGDCPSGGGCCWNPLLQIMLLHLLKTKYVKVCATSSTINTQNQAEAWGSWARVTGTRHGMQESGVLCARDHEVPPSRRRRRSLGEMFYSSFSCSFFWKQTGRMESTASTPSTAREFQDTASPAVVSLYSVVPALMATNEGGATPDGAPREHTLTKQPLNGTSQFKHDNTELKTSEWNHSEVTFF